jgi:hypothetical protein
MEPLEFSFILFLLFLIFALLFHQADPSKQEEFKKNTKTIWLPPQMSLEQT